jgi:hypothetical protein
MHRNEIKVNICTKADIVDTAGNNQPNLEQEANQFASYFLMPSRFVRNYYLEATPSMDPIREVAEKFDVSLTAAARRFISFSSEPVALVFLRAGRIEWFEASKDFLDVDVFVDVGKKVGLDTNAGRIFNGLSVPDGWYQARASAWLREGNFREDATIKEWSINMKSYGSVLSLLWIDDEIYDDEY